MYKNSGGPPQKFFWGTSVLIVCSYPRRPWLHVDRLVEFGVLVKGCRVISHQIFVHNDGSVDGQFHFNYAGNVPLTIAPWSGSVAAKSSKIIKVHFLLSAALIAHNNITVHYSNNNNNSGQSTAVTAGPGDPFLFCCSGTTRSWPEKHLLAPDLCSHSRPCI